MIDEINAVDQGTIYNDDFFSLDSFGAACWSISVKLPDHGKVLIPVSVELQHDR